MNGATMFSGIVAPEVAMPWVNWRWCAEIDNFACRLLKHRHPHLVNLGDVTVSTFIARALTHGPLDLLVFGSPCQAFSVAGHRHSLDDARGNLTLLSLEIIDAVEPGFVLWENVPGVLSTADNAFGCFLAGLVGDDSALVPPRGQRWTDTGVVDGPKRSAAWRILDAQYFGLAQRRRRVFVVASPRGWPHPAEILFEREGVQRYSAPSREAGKGVAGTLSARVKGGGGLGTDFDLDGGLVIEHAAFGGNNTAGPIDIATACNAHGGSGRMDFETETFITHSLRGDGFDASEDGTGRGTPLVVAFSCKDYAADAGDIAPTLRAMQHDASHANAGGQLAIAFRAFGQDGFRPSDLSPPIIASDGGGAGVPTVAFNLRGREGGAMPEPAELASLRSASGGSSRTYLAGEWGVRRLTPLECERLQGFEDLYTLVPGAADGPRYRALGNSMAVPVIAYLGKRIHAEFERCRRTTT